MQSIAVLGELLIDFTPQGLNKNIIFKANPGGAPANVAVGLARLGINTSFIGKVGNDRFGIFLKETLDNNNVNTEGLLLSNDYPTTLAFVHLDKNKDRSFTFYRKNCADNNINKMEVNTKLIEEAISFHFGSLLLTNEPARSAALYALKTAKKCNLLISYDPNYRPLLWENKNEARHYICCVLKFVDILKVSEEEFSLITGTEDLKAGSKSLYNAGIKTIFVTLGKKGAFYFYRGGSGFIESINVKTVDTTGAGDAFTSGILYYLYNKNKDDIDKISKKELERIIYFANIYGALTTTKMGAIPALPKISEIKKYFNKNNL